MTEKTSPPKVTDKNAREIIADRKAKKAESDAKPAPKKAPPEKNVPLKKSLETPQKTNWSARLLVMVIIFLLGSGTALYFLPQLKDRLPTLARWVGETPEADSALLGRIAALEDRLSRQGSDILALQNTPPVSTPGPDPLMLERLENLENLEQARLKDTAQNEKGQKVEQDLSQSARIDMLLGRMSQLEASFVPLSKGLLQGQDARRERSQLAETAATQTEQLAGIESRLGRVEAFAARDTSGALLAFRIGDLRQKVTSGKAYGPELDALRSLMTEDSLAQNDHITPALRWLSQHQAGLVTAVHLHDHFDALIPALIRAKSGGQDDPWWTRAYHGTKNLIMVRKTEQAAEDTLDDLIARSQQALAQRDLTGALALIRQLPANVQEKLETWTLSAEIYLQAGDQLDRIESLTAAEYLETTEPAPAPHEETPS
ncbi:MAG: hypothetical protein JKY94_06980 [Rhodobacteraceae bacterium]|nr:hypothetical protein [Paracoccaceae bacterium]